MEKLNLLKDIISLLESNLISKDEFIELKSEIFNSCKIKTNYENSDTKIRRKRNNQRKYLSVEFDDGIIFENIKNSKDTYHKSLLKMVKSNNNFLDLDFKVNCFPLVVDEIRKTEMPDYLRESLRPIKIDEKEYWIQLFGSLDDFKNNLTKIKNQLEKKQNLNQNFTIKLIKK